MHKLKRIWVLTEKEWQSFYHSPIAYLALVSFLLIAGWMYFSNVFIMNRADLRHFFTPSLFSPSMVLLIMVPALTMRLLAEERKLGTYELLATMPISASDIVLAKFFAAFGVIGVMLGLTSVYAFTIAALGDLDFGPVLCGYLGLILFASSLVAVGLLTSAWTKNQIIAFIVAFLLSACFYYIHWLQFFVPQSLAWLVSFVASASHLENMSRGVIDSRDVLYYLTITFGALLFAVRSLHRLHA